MKLLISHSGIGAITRDLIKKNNVLLIHALEVERDIPSELTGRKSWADLMRRASRYLLRARQASIAERILCTIADVVETDRGATSLYYLRLLSDWAGALHGLGNYEAAGERFLRVTSVTQAKLQDRAETDSKISRAISNLSFTSTLNLARSLDAQNRSADAEPICLNLLKQSSSSRDFSQICNVLGRIKMTQKDYPLAREYFLDHLQDLGLQNSADLCVCLLNLGVAEHRQDNQSKTAELHVKRARDMNFEVFGNDHVDTAMCCEVLGHIKKDQGQDQKALDFYEAALPGYSKWYGADAQQTVQVETLITDLERKMRLQANRSGSAKGKEPQQNQQPAPRESSSDLPRGHRNASSEEPASRKRKRTEEG